MRPWITSRRALFACQESRTQQLFRHQPRTTPGGRILAGLRPARWQVLAPKITVDKILSPKLFAGEYGAEIFDAADVKIASNCTQVFTTAISKRFSIRSRRARSDKRMTIIATTGEAAESWRASRQDAERHHHRRPRSRTARSRRTSELNRWFQEDLLRSLQCSTDLPRLIKWRCSLLGLKLAYERPRKAKAKPTTDRRGGGVQGVSSSRGPSGKVKLAIGDGPSRASRRPLTAPNRYQTRRRTNTEIVDIMRFPAELRDPPAGINADDWIKEGMKGAKC